MNYTTLIYVTELICGYKSEAKETSEMTTWNHLKSFTSEFYFRVKETKHSQMRKWSIYMWTSYPEKLFLNQRILFICRSMSLWSRHVWLEYINMIFDTSIRILNTPAQLTMPVFLFLKSPSLFLSAIPILCGSVSLFIADKFKDGHLTKYEMIRFSLKGSWNLELNQRLRGYSNQLQPGK